MTQKVFLLLVTIAIVGLVSCQPTPSDHCLSLNQSTGLCQSCDQGFYLQLYFCLPCSPLCTCSDKSNFCQSCVSVQKDGYTLHGYYTGGSLPRCNMCYEAMQYCASCNSSTQCLQCYGGYYVNKTSGACSQSKCQNNCLMCQNSSACRLCLAGYQLNDQTGSCSQILCSVPSCLQCINTSNTQCNRCQPKYYLLSSNSTCQPCMSDCLECTGPVSCSACAPGFVFQNGSCQDTGLSNCVRYSQDYSVCLNCQPNYYIYQGSCNQCSGCQLCKTGYLCDSQCLQGFYQFNYNCLAKSQLQTKVAIWTILIIVTLFLY